MLNGHPSLGKALTNDERGVTIIEFAIIAPILCLILMFLFDTGYYLYANAILGGEVNAAGRSSTLETATVDKKKALDDHVEAAIKRLVPNGTISFERKGYMTYARAQARAEAFVDSNNNGICDNGESFEDTNRNGKRDLDGGVDGGGGARDVTVYNVTLSYKRIFPLNALLGISNEARMTASTLLRNQPFDMQGEAVIGHCK